MTDINEIAVCATGDTWETVALADGFEDGTAEWFETRADAVKAARKLFNATPSAKRLIVENRRECCFKTVRTRRA